MPPPTDEKCSADTACISLGALVAALMAVSRDDGVLTTFPDDGHIAGQSAALDLRAALCRAILATISSRRRQRFTSPRRGAMTTSRKCMLQIYRGHVEGGGAARFMRHSAQYRRRRDHTAQSTNAAAGHQPHTRHGAIAIRRYCFKKRAAAIDACSIARILGDFKNISLLHDTHKP